MSVHKDETVKISKKTGKNIKVVTWYFTGKYITHEGKQRDFKRRGFSTQAEAKDAERLFLLNLKEEVTELQYVDLLKLYTKDLENKVVTTTYKEKEYLITSFIQPFFKNIDVKKLSNRKANEFRSYLDNLEKSPGVPYSTEYKNKIIMLCVASWKFGIKYYDLGSNPFSVIDKFKKTFEEEISKNEIWTKEQFQQFLEIFDLENFTDFVSYVLFITLATTGLRRAEIKAITWKDLDTTQSTLNINKAITGKQMGDREVIGPLKTTNSIRNIYIDDHTLALLLELQQQYQLFEGYDDAWYIFGGIKPIPNTTLAKRFARYYQMANVPGMRLHDFRHMHASNLILNGVNIVYVSKRLGHSNIEMTLNTYTHLIKDLEKKETSKINEIMNYAKT